MTSQLQHIMYVPYHSLYMVHSHVYINLDRPWQNAQILAYFSFPLFSHFPPIFLFILPILLFN